jgi:hypothetical protein
VKKVCIPVNALLRREPLARGAALTVVRCASLCVSEFTQYIKVVEAVALALSKPAQAEGMHVVAGPKGQGARIVKATKIASYLGRSQ